MAMSMCKMEVLDSLMPNVVFGHTNNYMYVAYPKSNTPLKYPNKAPPGFVGSGQCEWWPSLARPSGPLTSRSRAEPIKRKIETFLSL